MTTQNLMFQFVNHLNGFTMQDLVLDWAELSEEDLKQISGGGNGKTIVIVGGTTTIEGGKVVNVNGTVYVPTFTIGNADESTFEVGLQNPRLRF